MPDQRIDTHRPDAVLGDLSPSRVLREVRESTPTPQPQPATSRQ